MHRNKESFPSIPCADRTTAKMVAENTGLDVMRFLSGSQGGDQQFGARGIAYNEIDLVLFSGTL
jgi:methylglyoxal synthase